MALASSEVRVAGTGEVYVAPVGTAAPSDLSTPLDEPWIGLGYSSEDGVTIARSVESEGISAWQSATPVRTIFTGMELTVTSQFLQSNKEILPLFFGGSEFAETAADSGVFKMDISTVPAGVERAVCIEWRDGSYTHRLYIARAEVSETDDVSLNRTSAVGWGMTFSALAPQSGPLATWLTDDPNFEPAA